MVPAIVQLTGTNKAPVHVMVNHIVAMRSIKQSGKDETPDCTELHMVTGENFRVTESPALILQMCEKYTNILKVVKP